MYLDLLDIYHLLLELTARQKNSVYHIYPNIFDIIEKIRDSQLKEITISIEEFHLINEAINTIEKLLSANGIEDGEKKDLINSLNIINTFICKYTGHNSDFSDRIDDKVKEIEFLKSKVSQLEKEKTLSGSITAKEIKEKEEEIEKYIKQLEHSETEKKELIKSYEAEKQRKNNDLEKDINKAFDALNDGASVINIEYKRLRNSYYIYGFLAFILMIYLCFSINNITGILRAQDTQMTYIQYISYYLPLAFCGTLIWICIIQMNRLQRQLIALADKIYRIKYLEGALKGLNNVEQDKKVIAGKTIEVLGKIIDRHLNNGLKDLDEINIKKEEDKDSNPIDEIIKIMKEYKELTTNK